MTINKYLMYILRDFLIACGCLMVIAVVISLIYSNALINSSLLWQIILVASAFTLFKFAFINKYDLGKKSQLVSFTVCSTLADICVIVWLCFFSRGKVIDIHLAYIYIVILIIVKGLIYAMMYIDGLNQAKQLNEKLKEYNSGKNQ